MFRNRSLVSIVVLSIILLSAFAPAYASPASSLPSGHSVVIDAAGPIMSTDPVQAKAEAEFRKVIVAKERAYYAGDVDRMMSYYADNAVSIEPGSPDVVDKATMTKGTKAFFEQYNIVGRLTIQRVTFSGDYATRQAEWDEVVTAKDGSGGFHQIGRCLLVWHKINGQWKVVTQIFNYVLPPTDLAADVK